MCLDFDGHHSGSRSFDLYIYFDFVIRCGLYLQVPVGFKKKKKKQVESPSIWSRVPETGSDPPIGSDRDSGRDTRYYSLDFSINHTFQWLEIHVPSEYMGLINYL